MSFEIDVEADESGMTSKVDLSGVPEVLHDLMRAYERDDAPNLERHLARARRVSINKDGSVAVEFLKPVIVREEHHTGVRLRPLKARDYFDGTTAELADSSALDDSIHFATRLVPKGSLGVIDELDTYDDMAAVYLGVITLRKNFSRPRL
jgi:hypothetical protein